MRSKRSLDIRTDVPRLPLAEIAKQFAKSRRQSGFSAHYVSQCRKTVNDLAKAFLGKTLPDLRTAGLDAWLGGLTFGAKTKNGTRIILVACGNWAEGRGNLIKGGTAFVVKEKFGDRCWQGDDNLLPPFHRLWSGYGQRSPGRRLGRI